MRETGGAVLSVLGAEWLIFGQAEPVAPVLIGIATGAGLLIWRSYLRHHRKN